MARKFLLPQHFPMVINVAKKLIIDPTMGAHDQFVVTVNGLEVARTLDEELCKVIQRFLGANISKCLGKTDQGRKLLETLYLLSQGQKPAMEYDKEGHAVVRDITEKKIIH